VKIFVIVLSATNNKKRKIAILWQFEPPQKSQLMWLNLFYLSVKVKTATQSAIFKKNGI
jgi:hypothetical protein